MKQGGKECEIANPREATEATVEKLAGNSKYVFRLVATNPSGSSIGNVLGPITTVEFASTSVWRYPVLLTRMIGTNRVASGLKEK